MKKLYISIFCIMIMLVSTIHCFSTSVLADNKKINNSVANILVDAKSKTTICENNANAKVQVASIVKLMTSLIVMEKIDDGSLKLSDKITSTENASGMGGSQVFIDPYQNYTVEEMLKSVIVASANDASVALAEHISGSEEEFVKLMNSRATELGLTNTLYANATGLPSPEQYSTAKDTAVLLCEVLKHKLYYNYSTIWMDELVHASGRKTEIVNTNKLIRYFKGCDSGKTGFTDEAGYCLTASAERDGMRFISVVLGAKNAQDRFNESAKLLNYGFANYVNEMIVDKSKAICEINIRKSEIGKINVYPSQDYIAITKKGEKSNLEISYDLKNYLIAPLKEGESIGTLYIKKDGVIISQMDIVVCESIDCLSIIESVKKIAENWKLSF